MIGLKSVVCAALALVSAPAMAQTNDPGTESTNAGPELGLGVLAHAVRPPFVSKAPAGTFYGRTVEGDSADIEVMFRTRPFDFALKPRLAVKAQVNTAGRTNLASVGAEWRQHVLGGRIYGQIGIGLTVHDGYTSIPDPFELAPGSADFTRRYALYSTRSNFGSRVLFNPNLSLGVRVSRAWAVEATWQHYSNGGVFGRANDGLDSMGIRLIRTLGRK